MKRLQMIYLLCCLSVLAWAEGKEFSVLDWNVLRFDSIAPEYRHTVVLNEGGSWTVSVEYPEYEPLSEVETEIARGYGDLVSEEIKVESDVRDVRGQWRLTYHFVPLVKQGGEYKKLLSAHFAVKRVSQARAAAVAAVPAERYASRSAMASGRWVKISITEDGIYRLTPLMLVQMGFSDISRVRLYGYGGHVQSMSLKPDTDFDDLPEVPLYVASDGSLLFWGNGLVSWSSTKRLLNTYAREACYFVSDVAPDGGTGPAERIGSVEPGESGGVTQTTTLRHKLIEADEYSMYKVGNKLVHADNYADGKMRSYIFSGVNASGRVQLTISFASAGLTNVNTMNWNVNGGTNHSVVLRASNTEYQHAVWKEQTTDVTGSGTNTWTVNMSAFAGIDAHLDYLALHYDSPLALEKGFTQILSSGANVKYEGLSGASNLKVMRLGKRGRKACLIPTQGESVTVPTSGDEYVAFDANYSFPTPNVVGQVVCQNLHALTTMDMVIVIPVGCTYLSEAERLAEAHRIYDGMTVGIVRVDQVYNEFSSGTEDATALRRFFKMLYDKGEGSDHRLKYVLMMADGAWDNRMLSTVWRNFDRTLYLPCLESDESGHAVNSYVVDDYYGMVGESTSSTITSLPIELAVGRFPVITYAQAKLLVDKTLRHISKANADAWKNVVVYIGDDDAQAKDYAAEMKGADRAAETALNPDGKDGAGLDVKKIMFDTYIRTTGISGNTYPEITKLIEKYQTDGALMMNYTGHGAPHVLSHENVVRLKDVKEWHGDNLPIWMTAACDVAPWDGQEDNIGEAALLNEKGGAVVFVGTPRTVYSSPNHNLNVSFTKYLFGTDDEGKRISAGWALAEAKNDNMSVNSLNYSYLGDPALTFGAPREKVVLESINGEIPNRDVMIKSSSKVVLKGHVEDADGNKIDDFNGRLTATLYDVKQTVSGLRNVTTSDYTYRYRDYNTILSHRTTRVENGEWIINMVTPKDILFADSSGRLVFYALNEEKTLEASGASTDFCVGGVGSDFDDLTEGPDMFLYLNNEKFQDGGVVNSTPCFFAHLEDIVDIGYLGNSLGHNLLLTIDGDPLQSYVMDDYFTPDGDDYTRGLVCRTLPAMAEGEHYLVFEAWNNQNLYSRKSLRFVVNSELEPDPVSVVISPNPASSVANIIVTHQFPGSLTYYEVRIYDTTGHLVWMQAEEATADMNGSYTVRWNASDVTSGVYPLQVTVRSGGGEEVYEGEKIIVLK
ncbi:MAG: type IX secretion system sortase PorU [Bacteroidaceae bacterium]|nr:type IX secretion system sortase PorU [Bacteroidaceae bacterium]